MSNKTKRFSVNPLRHLSSEGLRASQTILWLVLGTIVVIFSLYEFVERMWLSDASEELIYLLHMLRGVGTGIAGAVVTVWYMLRVGPTIFPSDSITRMESFEETAPAQEREAHFGHWMVRMRWLACAVSTILILVVVKGFGYLDDVTFLPLTFLVLCLVFSNFMFGLMLRREWFSGHLAELQIGSDLLILTGMLHFSGGVENPLFFVYVFHVIIGGIFFDRLRCYAIVLIASGLFAATVLAEMMGVVEHYTLLVFPHGSRGAAGEYAFHAAHDATYVVSMIGLQFVLLALTAQFILMVMERLRAEELQRHAVSRRLERVMEATDVGFIVLDKDLNPLWLNAQLMKWLNVPDLAGDRRYPQIEEWIGGREGIASWTLNDGKTRTSDREWIDAQGNKHFLHTTVSAIRGAEGEVYEVVELTQDVTERRILEAETLNAKRLAQLGTLAAGIAHEIGNPLASISSQLQLLERKRSESFLEESLTLIHEQIDRLSLIVRDISQFARPAQKRRDICQVNAILGEAITLMRFHRQTRAIQIDSDLDEALPDTMAVKDELIQVFLNLGFNAIEAMTGGGTLTIGTYTNPGEIVVEFADTGPGLPDDIRSRVFEPFFTSKEDGLGLGLSVSHKIATLHGGRIEATNRSGGGALFTVILPIRNAT